MELEIEGAKQGRSFQEPSGEPTPNCEETQEQWRPPPAPQSMETEGGHQAMDWHPALSYVESTAAKDETVILAMVYGLDASSVLAIRDCTAGDSILVQIPWPPAQLEGTSPQLCHSAAQALAFLLAGREGLQHQDSALKERPEGLLDLRDTSTREGLWEPACKTQPWIEL